MATLASELRNKKFIDAEVDISNLLKEKNISKNAMIFSLKFDKKVFKKESEVREWMKYNYYFTDDVIDEENSFIVNTLSTSQLDMATAITMELRRGVEVSAADFFSSRAVEYQFSDKDFTTDFKEGNKDNALPKIIKIAKVIKGVHAVFGDINITKEHLLSFKANFEKKVTGVDLAINEDHKKNEAFGWYRDVFLNEDETELLATVKWNKKGTKSLNEGEYRYFSPEFNLNWTHPHTGVEHGPTLLGGALTNYPFLKMDAITDLSQKTEQLTKENNVENIALSEHNKVVVELSTKNIDLSNKLAATEGKVVELSNKVAAMEADKNKMLRESANKKLFDDGLINNAQLIALNEGKSMLEILALNAKTNMSAQGGTPNVNNQTIELSDADKKMAKSMGLTEAEYAAANGIK